MKQIKNAGVTDEPKLSATAQTYLKDIRGDVQYGFTEDTPKEIRMEYAIDTVNNCVLGGVLNETEAYEIINAINNSI